MLHDVLERREEFAATLDEDQDPVVFPDYAALFHGRVGTQGQSITIGPTNGEDDLRIEVSTLEPDQQSLFTAQPTRVLRALWYDSIATAKKCDRSSTRRKTSRRLPSRASRSGSRLAPGPPPGRILLVEGADDKHVVRHLCNAKPDIPAFEIADKTGFPALIRAIGPEIKAPGRLAVGILAMRTTIRRHGGSR